MLSLIFLAAVLATAYGTLVCDDGWDEYFGTGNMCIKAFIDEKPWLEAFKYCQKTGAKGNLVSVHNAFQNAAVATVGLNLKPKCDYWIGLYDFGSGFQWTDSTTLDYQNWAPEYPGEHTDATATYISPSERNRWENVLELSEKNCFVCQKAMHDITPTTTTTTITTTTTRTTTTKCPTTTTTTTKRPTTTTTQSTLVTLTPGPTTTPRPTTTPGPTTTHAPQSCKPGWLPYGNACYYHSGDVWFAQQDAEAHCETEKSTLVSILSQDEQQFLNRNYGTRSMYWIGLVKAGSSWAWIDGSTFDYSNWHKMYPDQSGDVCVIAIEDDGVWANYQCTNKYTFVCKYIRT